MADNRRTVVVPEGDWERWGDLAWKARVSRSEYIRRAVEAYQHGEGDAKGKPNGAVGKLRHGASADNPTGSAGHDEPSGKAQAGTRGRGEQQAPPQSRRAKGGAVKREAKAPQQRESDPAAPPSMRVRSVPKELQTRRRKG